MLSPSFYCLPGLLPRLKMSTKSCFQLIFNQSNSQLNVFLYKNFLNDNIAADQDLKKEFGVKVDVSDRLVFRSFNPLVKYELLIKSYFLCNHYLYLFHVWQQDPKTKTHLETRLDVLVQELMDRYTHSDTHTRTHTQRTHNRSAVLAFL